MRVLVNALSATNLSGREVLLGHLSRLSAWTLNEHEFVVLHHAVNRDIRRQLGPNVSWKECPARNANWVWRTVFERTVLPRMVKRLGIDVYFTPSGTVIAELGIPQVSLALNPWCLVPGMAETVPDRLKAALQRYAYREAVRRASMMAYASQFIRDAFRANAGGLEKLGVIAYPGVGEDAIAAAAELGSSQREQYRVLCASVMAPHKGVETVVSAVAELRREHDVPAVLHLVGGWPSSSYENSIRALVAAENLGDFVFFEGHMIRRALFEHYARARVFCLMSRCESFGIPSVEAQTFGTPVVTSDCCAMPEVCGLGAAYAKPGDVSATARALARLLVDNSEWQKLSASAVANAAGFRYEKTTKPLMQMFETAGAKNACRS